MNSLRQAFVRMLGNVAWSKEMEARVQKLRAKHHHAGLQRRVFAEIAHNVRLKQAKREAAFKTYFFRAKWDQRKAWDFMRRVLAHKRQAQRQAEKRYAEVLMKKSIAAFRSVNHSVKAFVYALAQPTQRSLRLGFSAVVVL